MSTHVPFGRLLTAMATAFHEDGTVDLDGTARIAAHLVDHGNDGVVVSGTTGESPTTSVAEDGEILRAVQDAVGDRAVVIAGVGTNSTAHSVELAEQAAKIGVDGVLLVSPYYNKPGQVGLRHHFSAVAEATDLPVMLYDVPGRTATLIELETYEAMRRYDHVTSVKDASGLLARTAAAGRHGLRRLLRRRRHHPRLPRLRRGRPGLGRRPRRRRPAGVDDRRLGGRRPRRGAAHPHLAASRPSTP